MTTVTSAVETDEEEVEVPKEVFFRIFGAGKRKVLQTPIKLRFDDQIVEFRPKDTAGVQAIIDFIVQQNTDMTAEISKLRGMIARSTASSISSATRPRVRVKVVGVKVAA